jgi:DNA helicase HerA-like ATPase
MGKLSQSLAKLLSCYVSTHSPTRVLTAGIPEDLFEPIAGYWPHGTKLFIVSEKKYNSLPSNVVVVKPDDLTAERQEGWAALVSPAQSRIIQESIRSAGAGTVREIWAAGFPWHECELPGVRWKDLLDEFIDKLGLSAEHRHAASCINCFRREMRGEVDASESFFSELDAVAGATVSVDDLCYHLGIPKHNEGQPLRDPKCDSSVLTVLEAFIERYSEEGAEAAGEYYSDVAKSIFSGDAKQPLVAKAIAFFTDNFRVVLARDTVSATRVWRAVFRSGRGHWEQLDADTLSALVGANSSKPSISVRNIEAGTGVQLFSYGSNRVLIRELSAHHKVKASLLYNAAMVSRAEEAAAAGSPWKQFVHRNRDRGCLLRNPVPSGAGPHLFDVPLVTAGKQVLRFFAGQSSTAQVGSLAKPETVWECCQEFPLILLHSLARITLRKRKKIKDSKGGAADVFSVEEQMVFPSQGRLVLHGFVYGLQGKLKVLLPDNDIVEEVKTTPSDSLGDIVQTFTLVVEAVEGSTITFEWTAKEEAHEARISFEFKDEAGPEENSLTDLLVRAHGAARSSAKAHFEKIKNGEKVIPGDVPIRATAKPIARWEVEHFRNKDTGWWPILASTSTNCSEQKLKNSSKNYCRFSNHLNLHEQANAWNSIIGDFIDPGPIPSEVQVYIESRRKLITGLEAQFEVASPAELEEVNLARASLISQLPSELLLDYFQSFCSLISAAQAKKMPEAWRWQAYAVDSVLLFSSGKSCPDSHLLGPFHPITLASLYYTHKCLADRLVEGELTNLAHVFVSSRPLAIGHTLDGQRQPAPAIAFPSGDPHWLWLFARRADVDVPGKDPVLLAWLRNQGLDPQAGPLGVDAEVLPQTLRQYALAHPSRQTLRLFLEDCSQQSYKEIKAELSESDADDDTEALVKKLTGGVEVYDPNSKVTMLDGENLVFEPDLPLIWYHSVPPSGVPLDVATLPPSNRVDFQETQNIGTFARWMPTARKSLVDFGPNGLVVSSALRPTSAIDLETTVAEMIRIFEEQGLQLAWGSSLIGVEQTRANWTLCSSSCVDPRLFIDYVRRNRNPAVALWTYKLFQLGDRKSLEFGKGHFLLAKVSPALAKGLASLLSALGLTFNTDDLLVCLAEAGLTLGDEFLRTGRAAEGAIGQFLVERLIWQPSGASAPLPHWTLASDGKPDSAGFLLQVDPFKEALEALAKIKRELSAVDSPAPDEEALPLELSEVILRSQNATPSTFSPSQRSDLISWHIRFCGDDLWIKPVVIESKCYPAASADVSAALRQAEATADLINKLLSFCQLGHSGRPGYWATPERLLLAELVHLGLRLSKGSFAGSSADWHEFEERVLSRILAGEYKCLPARFIAIVHSSAATKDELQTNDPHAVISFADANTAICGGLVGSYEAIRQSLAKLLRHVCDARHVEESGNSQAQAEAAEVSVTTSEVGSQDSSQMSAETSGVESTAQSNVSATPPDDLSPVTIPQNDSHQPETKHEEQRDVPSASPDNIIGAGSIGRRWAILGKLAGTTSTIALDLDQPKAVGIFGYMGSGKSYLLGTIIESAAQKIPHINSLEAPLAVVVFNYRRNAADRFELSSLSEPNSKQDDALKLLSEYGANPVGVRDVHVVALPGELTQDRLDEYGAASSQELFFDPGSLGAEDWALLMGDPSSDTVFARTIKNTLVDLRAGGAITLSALETDVLARLTQSNSRNAASLRFDFVRRYLSAERGCDFASLIKPGRVLVFDLRAPLFDKDDALRFFLICANHISKVQGQFNKLIIFDEAHEYLSTAFGERMEARIRLMRHEGTSYIFATQDASSIPSNISRFLSTLFVFDMGTQENSEDLVELSSTFAQEHLVGMKAGKCLVQSNLSSQRFFQKPREMDVRPRATQHGGHSRIFT